VLKTRKRAILVQNTITFLFTAFISNWQIVPTCDFYLIFI